MVTQYAVITEEIEILSFQKQCTDLMCVLDAAR